VASSPWLEPESFSELVAGPYFDECARLAARLARGEADVREWADGLGRAILSGHSRAWRWARASSGDLEESEADGLVGRARLDAEAPYLLRFAEQVEGGWGGEMVEAAVARRSGTYAGAIRGTATEGFFSLGDPADEYRWVLGAVEDHCTECPSLAAAGPWKPDELYVWPGSNDTPCLFNCKCHLSRVSDGAASPGYLF